jgi:hypothetical protein
LSDSLMDKKEISKKWFIVSMAKNQLEIKKVLFDSFLSDSFREVEPLQKPRKRHLYHILVRFILNEKMKLRHLWKIVIRKVNHCTVSP